MLVNINSSILPINSSGLGSLSRAAKRTGLGSGETPQSLIRRVSTTVGQVLTECSEFHNESFPRSRSVILDE